MNREFTKHSETVELHCYYCTFSVAIHAASQLSSHKTANLICYQSSWLARFVLKLANYFYSHRVDLRYLDCTPSLLPASILSDRDGKNLRPRINQEVITVSKSIASKIVNPFSEGGVFGAWAIRECIPALLEFQIASKIQEHVFVFWNARIRQQQLQQHDSVKVFTPESWWGRELAREMSVSSDAIDIVCKPCEKKNVSLFISRAEGILVRLAGRFFGTSESGGRSSKIANLSVLSPPKVTRLVASAQQDIPGTFSVGTCIADGVSPDTRNSLNWAWQTSLPGERISAVWPDQFLVIRHKKPDLNTSLNSLRLHRRKDILFSNANNSLDIPVWRSTHKYYLYRVLLMLKVFRHVAPWRLLLADASGWVAMCLLGQGRNFAWWCDYFDSNHVKINVEELYGPEIYARALAIDYLAGVNVLTERSMTYGNNSYLMNRVAHYSLIAGPYSEACLTGIERSNHKIKVGYYFDQMENTILKNQCELAKATLLELGYDLSKPVILFCDEPGVIYGASEVFKIYQSILGDLATNENYLLIVKPKKKHIFDSLPDSVYSQLQELVSQKHCCVLDPGFTISLAASIADVTVSVPSTAMFTSMALNRRTVVLNPYRTISGIFYRQGLENICIFDRSEDLLRSLQDWITNQSQAFGDCSKVFADIDEYGDGRTSLRIDRFLKILATEFEKNNQMDAFETIASVAQEYDASRFQYAPQ